MKYANIAMSTDGSKPKSFKEFLNILSENKKDFPERYRAKIKKAYPAVELDDYCSSQAGEKALQKILKLKDSGCINLASKISDILTHDLELFHLKHFVKNSNSLSPVRYNKSKIVRRQEDKKLFTTTSRSISRVTLRAFTSFLKQSSVVPVELKQDKIKIYDEDDNEKILNISQLSFLSTKKHVLCCTLYKAANSARERYNSAQFYCITVDADFAKHCVIRSWTHDFSAVVASLVQYVNDMACYKNLLKHKGSVPDEFKTLDGVDSTVLYREWTISRKGIDDFIAGKPVILKPREYSSWSPYKKDASQFASPLTKKEGGLITKLPASKADVLINLMHPLLLPYAQEAEVILNSTGVKQLDKSNSELVE